MAQSLLQQAQSGKPMSQQTAEMDALLSMPAIAEMFMPERVTTESKYQLPFYDVAVASLAKDPERRKQYFAQQLGLPVERFGTTPEGEVVYVTDDGKIAYVNTGLLGEIAEQTGELFQPIGAIGGSLLAASPSTGTATKTPAGFTAMATSGATIGEAARQELANLVMGEPRDVSQLGWAAAFEAGGAGIATLIGKGMSRAMASRYFKKYADVLKRGDKKDLLAAQEALDAVNKEYGTSIVLTPAELTKVVSLGREQRALSDLPKTADYMQQFYAGRGEQAQEAGEAFIRSISPIVGEEAGIVGRKAAKESIELLKDQRKAAAKPFYTKAQYEAGRNISLKSFDSQVNLTIRDFPQIEGQLNSLKKGYTEVINGKRVLRSDMSLEQIQQSVKEPLDDIIKLLNDQKRFKAANRAQALKDSLLSQLDTAAPSYAKAREVWGDLSGDIELLEAGSLTRISKLTDDELMDAGRFILSDSPAAITRARTNILALPDGEAKYNALLRGALDAQWEAASRESLSGLSRPDAAASRQVLSFWSKMAGNKAQKKKLRAAMSPEQFDAFEKLMTVYSRIGQTVNYNSTSAQQLGVIQDVTENAMGTGAMTNILSPFGIPRKTQQAAQRGIINANLNVLAKAITDPDSINQLRKIKTGEGRILSPANINIVTNVIEGAVLQPFVFGEPFGGATEPPPIVGEMIQEKTGKPLSLLQKKKLGLD
jgi:hypothetical protein